MFLFSQKGIAPIGEINAHTVRLKIKKAFLLDSCALITMESETFFTKVDMILLWLSSVYRSKFATRLTYNASVTKERKNVDVTHTNLDNISKTWSYEPNNR